MDTHCIAYGYPIGDTLTSSSFRRWVVVSSEFVKSGAVAFCNSPFTILDTTDLSNPTASAISLCLCPEAASNAPERPESTAGMKEGIYHLAAILSRSVSLWRALRMQS